MADKLEIRNTSGVHDIKVSVQNQLHDEFGNPLGEWGPATPESRVSPLDVAFVMLHPKRRTILETNSPEDIVIGIANESLFHTLKLSSVSKKSGPTPVGFVAPMRNGQGDGLNITISKSASAAIQQMPV